MLQLLAQIAAMFAILIMVSCTRLTNAYHRAVLDCGSGIKDTSTYAKILDIEGKELEGRNLVVYYWASGELVEHAATEKACVSVREGQSLIVRDRASGAALRVSSWNGEAKQRLQKVSETQLALNCAKSRITSQENIRNWIPSPKDALSTYQLSMSLRDTAGKLLNEKRFLLSNESKVEESLQLEDRLLEFAEGPYVLDLSLTNLLRETEVQSISCPLVLDNTPPRFELSNSQSLQRLNGTFELVKPFSEFKMLSDEADELSLRSCWIPVKEAEIASLHEDILCSLEQQSASNSILLPGSGYWLLRYQVQDLAGNTSPVHTKKLLVYNSEAIDRIGLLAESSVNDVENLKNGRLSIYKALEAETRRKHLGTAFERKAAAAATHRALYKLVHRVLPVHEISSPELIWEVYPTPDQSASLSITRETGQIQLHDPQGKLLWQSSLDDIPAGVAFSKNSELVAISGSKGVIKLWSLKSGELLSSTQAESRVLYLEFDPSSTLLAGSFNDGRIVLWNLEQSAKPNVIEEKTIPYGGLSWHPDGKSFLVAKKNLIYAYGRDGLPLAPPQAFAPESGHVTALKHLDAEHIFILSVAKDASQAQSGEELSTQVSIVDSTFKVLRSDILGLLNPNPNGQITPEQLQRPNRLRLSPDGESILAYGRTHLGIQVWESWRKALEENGSLAAQSRAFRTVSTNFAYVQWFQDSKRIFARSFDFEIVAYNEHGQILKQFSRKNAEVTGGPASILDLHNRMIISNTEGKISYWPLRSEVFPSYVSTSSWLEFFRESPNGQLFLSVEAEPKETLVIKILDRQYRVLYTWPFADEETKKFNSQADIKAIFQGIDFLDNERIIVGGLKGGLKIKSLKGQDLGEYQTPRNDSTEPLPPQEFLTSFGISQDRSSVMLGYANGSVRLLSLPEFKPMKLHTGHGPASVPISGFLSDRAVLKIMFDPLRGAFLSSGLDGKIFEWNEDFEPRLVFESPGGLETFDLSSAGDILIAPYNQKNLFVTSPSSENPRSLPGIRRVVTKIASSADGTHFAGAEGLAGTNYLLYLWNAEGELLHEFDFHTQGGSERYLRFSSDGRTLRAGIHMNLYEIPVDPNMVYETFCKHLGSYVRERDKEDLGVCRDILE